MASAAEEPPDPLHLRSAVEERTRDDDTYESFYEHILPWLVGRARLLGPDAAAEAYDLAQDVLVQAWKHWSALRGEAPCGRRAYVYRSLINACCSRRRWLAVRRAKQPRLWIREAIDDVESTAMTNLEASDALDIIRVLPPRQRQVFVLAADGFERTEIAKLLGCSPASVRSNLHHARQTIIEHMKASKGVGRGLRPGT